MTQPKDVARQELIGKNAKITESTNKTQNGINGKIINETKNTITIETKKGNKIIQKNNITIDIKTDNKIIRIKGKKIEGRPEDRIKRKVK
jgi:ribonuclease P protein subunit POP4